MPFLLGKVTEKILGIKNEEEKKHLEIHKLFDQMQVINMAPGEDPGAGEAKKEYHMTEVKSTKEAEC